MPLLGFIEARDPFEGHDPEPERQPWALQAFDWLFPWPAVVVWLCVASRYADGWAGVGLIYAAIVIAAWRALRLLPTHGLKDDRQ